MVELLLQKGAKLSWKESGYDRSPAGRMSYKRTFWDQKYIHLKDSIAFSELGQKYSGMRAKLLFTKPHWLK